MAGIAAVIIILTIGTQRIEKPPKIDTEIQPTEEKENPVASTVYNATGINLDMCMKAEGSLEIENCTTTISKIKEECKKQKGSLHSLCNDPRLDGFQKKLEKDMENLNESLLELIGGCMDVKSQEDIESCSENLARIKNDCEDLNFSSSMSVCNDKRFDKFNEKYKDLLVKFKPE